MAAWCPGVALSAAKHPAARTDQTPFAYNTSGVVGIGAAPSTVLGPAVLQFQGLTGASYNPASGQPISLGQFVTNPASTANGATTIYSGTPFAIQIQAPELDKTSTFPVLGKLFPGLGKTLSLKTVNQNSVILKGHLDGTVAPNGLASVMATVDAVKLGSLSAPAKDHITHYTFPIHFSQLKLPPSWVLAGSTVPTGSTLRLTSTATAAPSPTVRAQGVAQPQLIVPSPAAVTATSTPIPTPEPSTLLVFAAAFGGLALAGRRRRPAR